MEKFSDGLKKRIKFGLYLFVLIIFIFLLFSLFSKIINATQCGYSGSGDWWIINNTICNNDALTINGNFYINSTGNLSARNTIITMDNSVTARNITNFGILEGLNLTLKTAGQETYGCSGTEIPCQEIFDSGSCGAQVGCYWDDLGQYCDGSAQPCSGFTDSPTCTAQQVCSWLVTSTTYPLTRNFFNAKGSLLLAYSSVFEYLGSTTGLAYGSGGLEIHGAGTIRNTTFNRVRDIVILNQTTIEYSRFNNSHLTAPLMRIFNLGNLTWTGNDFNSAPNGKSVTMDNNSNLTIRDSVFNAQNAQIVLTGNTNMTFYNVSAIGSGSSAYFYLRYVNNSNFTDMNFSASKKYVFQMLKSNNNIFENINATPTSFSAPFYLLDLNNSNSNIFNRIFSKWGVTNAYTHLIFLNSSNNNTFSKIDANFIMDAISIYNSSNNHITSSSMNAQPSFKGGNTTVVIGNSNNNIIDSTILNNTQVNATLITMKSGQMTFINNSFNLSKYLITGGLFNVKWFTDINTTFSNGSIAPSSNITLWNRTNDYFISALTDLNGMFRINLTDYTINATNTTSAQNNYTINGNNTLTTANYSAQFNNSNSQFNTPLLMYNITFATAIADNIFPLWNFTAKNESIVYQNTLINFSAIITDETALSNAIFIINLTGNFFNSSAYGFTGGNPKFNNMSNVTRIAANQGSNVTWFWYFNDTSNNVNMTKWQSFTVADNTTPLYSDVQKNKSFIVNDDLVNFTLNITDNLNLDKAVFSIDLGSGYINSSYYGLSGSWANISNLTRIIAPNNQDTNVSWFWFFNDTSGNSNATGLDSFIVDRLAPNISFLDPANNSLFITNGSEYYTLFINITNSSADKVWFYNSTRNITYTAPFNLTLYYNSEIPYVLEAYTNDSSNNVNKTQVMFRIRQFVAGGGGGGIGGGGIINETNVTLQNATNLTLYPLFNWNEFIKDPFRNLIKNKYGGNITILLSSLFLVPVMALFLYIRREKRKKGIINIAKKDKNLRKRLKEKNIKSATLKVS